MLRRSVQVPPAAGPIIPIARPPRAHDTMIDRLLIYALQFTIVGLISASAVGWMIAGFQGFLQLLAQKPGGGGWIALSLGLGITAYQLCRHRNDLVDR